MIQSKTVRLSGSTIERLKKYAIAFKDTPSKAIDRILRFLEHEKISLTDIKQTLGEE